MPPKFVIKSLYNTSLSLGIGIIYEDKNEELEERNAKACRVEMNGKQRNGGERGIDMKK